MAAIYGRILKALRYLSNGEVVMTVASDFMGDKVGESQTKTRALLEMSEGKVLFIDEAYALDDQLYGKQVLDTLVEKVQATAGADLVSFGVVILFISFVVASVPFSFISHFSLSLLPFQFSLCSPNSADRP